MTLKIIGSARSRTMRTLWVAAELQLEFEHLPSAWDDPRLKRPEFMDLNPAGAIPTIIDDGFALAESMAINLYLTKTYGREHPPSLYPTAPEAEAQVWRWSLWAQGHIEPWVQRDVDALAVREAAPEQSSALPHKSLSVLDRALADRDWLVEGRFTVADLNVAGTLSPSRTATAGIEAHRNVSAWLSRCYQRPAAARVRQQFA